MADDGHSHVLLTQNETETVPNTPAQEQKTNKQESPETEENELTEEQKLDIIAKQLSRAFGDPPDVPEPGRRGDTEDDLKQADEKGYVPPVQDPYQRAITYLEKHNILQVFQYITSGIVYKRPDDPINFMIDECAKLKEKRDSGKEMILDIVKKKDSAEAVNEKK